MSRSLEEKLQEIRDTLQNVKNQMSCEHDKGLYNGLEHALSVIEERQPDYIESLPTPPPEVVYLEKLEELLKRLRRNPLQN